MRNILFAAATAILAGCVPVGHDPIQPGPQPLVGCAAVAQDRVNDAAANGYNAVMQTIVYRDAYTACEAKQISGGAEPLPAKQPSK